MLCELWLCIHHGCPCILFPSFLVEVLVLQSEKYLFSLMSKHSPSKKIMLCLCDLKLQLVVAYLYYQIRYSHMTWSLNSPGTFNRPVSWSIRILVLLIFYCDYSVSISSLGQKLTLLIFEKKMTRLWVTFRVGRICAFLRLQLVRGSACPHSVLLSMCLQTAVGQSSHCSGTWRISPCQKDFTGVDFACASSGVRRCTAAVRRRDIRPTW
jgi:hypothetical protein